MVDADNFKLYNDAYGHPAGDDVLTNIAQCLTMSSQRAGDLAARYGGEEFVMLLPNTGLEGATRVAERVRHGVEALNISHTASPSQRVTVSIGVAVASPSSTDIASALLKCADDALYAAKHHGRNCVRVAESATVDKMLRLKIAS
jgi:diguanylate cyclase (GGDEF)-like protein